jgi:ribose transport system ATP-binding protein
MSLSVEPTLSRRPSGDASSRETFSDGPLLQLNGISKSFPGVRALNDVSLTLHAGEVVAIVGENGAGKSTLLKVLGGILRPDEGEILVDGNARQLRGVRDALSLGIGLIHQELNLAPAMSVAENLYLGRQPYRGPRWLRFTDRRKMNSDARAELKRVGLVVSPKASVGGLDIARRQLVEIAKALATQARILVLDEPTSSLSLTEADRLLAILDELRSRGAAILYVSHRLSEVQRIADRVAVLRDGKLVGTLAKGEISQQRLISLMVGRDLPSASLLASSKRPGAPALAVKELRLTHESPAISFNIQPGEIVGFAGIMGAGRTELARAIFGIDRRMSGEIYVNGEKVEIVRPQQAVDAGLALVPEDRKALGIMLEMSVRSNASLAALRRLAAWGRYNGRAEKELALRFKQSLNIRCGSLAAKASSLSGGNQQKVVLAKWLAMDPKVLILDEPTRGVDIGAKLEIYRLIREMAAGGMAVMLISSELEEIIALSNRVLVMHRGAISGELTGPEFSEEKIMRLAVGAAANANER